jgi:2-polyprenyl-6-methoxyphenol hydroxylase-like FAD-dependent oxidoreductase
MSMTTTQVAIVGGGPVGLSLALDLGLRGIKCALIERRGEMHNIPKGQNLTARTMEHFQFWGVEKDVRAARVMPKDFPIGEVLAYRNLTTDWWQASPDREQVLSFYSQKNERMPQYQVETVLRKAVAKLPSVELIYDWTASSLTQNASGVELVLEGPKGEARTILADYCVGADGGRSMVRESVGIARSGTDFGAKMALLVFRSKELHERLQRFPKRSTYTVLKPELNGYWQFFGRVDVGEGWFFHAPVPNDADKDFDFTKLLHDAAGFEFACEFDHIGFWDCRVAIAERYQVGRVFIAGDAAHTHPPYGGFGLNNGVEDAANLGWKLATVLKGWGGAGLLDTYSQERQPIFRDIGEDFIAGWIREEGEWLQRYNPDKNLEEFENAWKNLKMRGGSRGMTYEPHYEGSPVFACPPGGKSSAHGQHMFKARAGHHLTPQTLADGRSNFDALGNEFTLLAFGAGDAADKIAASAKQLGIPLTVLRDSNQAARDAYEADLILVRPDQYVVWTGSSAPDDVGQLLGKVTGR